jgi:hypothetical protein
VWPDDGNESVYNFLGKKNQIFEEKQFERGFEEDKKLQIIVAEEILNQR